MKKFFLIITTAIFIISCKEKQPLDIQFITTHFNQSMEEIDQVQYDVRNELTFSDGTAWDNDGFAFIKKEPNDTLFGFSFYGIRNDINKSFIYRRGAGFNIKNNDETFEQEKGSYGSLGSPGGQMIYQDFFELEEEYETVTVTETEDSYLLNYKFDDDLENKVTEKTKKLELDKKTFLPKYVYTSLKPDFGEKQTKEYTFTNMKVNDSISKNIDQYILDLNELELIPDEETVPSPLLNKVLPEIALKELFDDKNLVHLKSDKIILLDFWEVWCGWCIKSFPDVENIKNKYQNDLLVLGIVTEDLKKAQELVIHKQTTFTNLIGDKEIHKIFHINSFPRYYLIDRDGLVLKEYFGFSKVIEKDIQELMAQHN